MDILKRIQTLLFNGGVLTGLLLCINPNDVIAGNGLNVIGFGHESIQMGGADIPVARDASALSTNPAGLSQIKGSVVDLDFIVIDLGRVTHSDQLGNRSHPDNSPVYAMSAAFARSLPDSPFSWGMGVFGQGGAGVEYKRLNTPFGTSDELSSQLRILKASAGAAYRLNDDLSLGVSLSLLQLELDQKIFPDTSVVFPLPVGGGFFGQEIQDSSATALGVRFGVMYQLTPRVKLGAAYSAASELDQSGDKFIIDFSAAGLGKVNYSSVKIKGREQPQEFGVGVFIQGTSRLGIALEASWIDWSSAMSDATLTATKPDSKFAPPVVRVKLVDDWRDQLVLALGLVYQYNDKLVLRGGFNYGRNPVPDDHLNPFLATITEKHITLGMSYRVSRSWDMSAGMQFDLENEATSTDPLSITGPGSTERIASRSLLLSTSYYW